VAAVTTSSTSGGRNPISQQTVIAFIEKALGKKAVIAGQPFHIADIKDGAPGAEMAKQTSADISKARRLLQPLPVRWGKDGWEPQVASEGGSGRTAVWHKANRSGLSAIKN
jgi:nucleoside-diphosphate-sugar epimerase